MNHPSQRKFIIICTGIIFIFHQHKSYRSSTSEISTVEHIYNMRLQIKAYFQYIHNKQLYNNYSMNILMIKSKLIKNFIYIPCYQFLQ